jgi:hypothetical protein
MSDSSSDLPMIQAEFRDFIERVVGPALAAFGRAVKENTEHRECIVKLRGLDENALGFAELIIRNTDNPNDNFVFRVVAVKLGPASAHMEYEHSLAVVDGELQSSLRGELTPQVLGRDTHLYRITTEEVQRFVQRRYDEVRIVRAQLGL